MVSINHRLQDQWDNAKTEASCAWSAVRHLPETALNVVDDRPLAMTFAAFGVGIGVGVALGMVIQESMAAASAPPDSWTRQAVNTMSQALPAAWARQFRA